MLHGKNKKSKKSVKAIQFIKASAESGYTEDLSDFGMREIELLRDILDAWLNNGLPDDFEYSGVKPAFNTYSGNVFLVNDEYQTCMEVDGVLESWYFTPYEGHEGFYEDLLDEADDSWNSEDLEYLRDIAENRGDSEGVDKLNALMGEDSDEDIEESVRAKGRKSVKASRRINRRPVKASARKRISVKASMGNGGTVTLKDTNTDVMPVVDFGCYGGLLRDALDDVFVAYATDIDSWDPTDEYYDEVVQLINEDYDGTEEFFEQVLSYAPSTIQDAFNEYGIPATVVKGSCKWHHPSYYNYSDDVIVFDMTIDANWVEDKFRELSNDSQFVSFLNKNYSSRDGFISFMPNNTSDYEAILDPNDSDYWKLVSAIVTYMVDSDPSIREEATEDLYESLRGNANYTTFSGLGVY